MLLSTFYPHDTGLFPPPPQDPICIQTTVYEISEGEDQFLLLYAKKHFLKEEEKVLKELEDVSLFHVTLYYFEHHNIILILS